MLPSYFALMQQTPVLNDPNLNTSLLSVAAIIVTGLIGLFTITANSRAASAKALAESHTKMVNDMSEENKALRKDMREVQQQYSELQDKYTNLSDAFNEQREENRTLNQRIDTIQDESEAKEKRAKMAIEQLTSDVDTERRAKETALVEVGKLRQQLEEAQQLVAARDAAIIALDERKVADDAKHEREKALLRSERDAAQQRVIALEAQIVDLTHQLDTAKTEIARLEAEKAKADEETPIPTPDSAPAADNPAGGTGSAAGDRPVDADSASRSAGDQRAADDTDGDKRTDRADGATRPGTTD